MKSKIKDKLILGLCLLAATATLRAQTVTRPISDWVNAQDMWLDITFVEPDNGNWIFVDYSGLLSQALMSYGYPDLGTSVSGTVTERPLKNGGTHVHVDCHTVNAFSYAGDYYTSQRWLGASVLEVLYSGAAPALGSCHLVLDWDTTSAPGTEDLRLVDLDWTVLSIKFEGSCSGLFTAESPYPAGTPGEAHTTQVSIAGKTQGKFATDGFATEFVRIQPTGR